MPRVSERHEVHFTREEIEGILSERARDWAGQNADFVEIKFEVGKTFSNEAPDGNNSRLCGATLHFKR